MKVCHILVSLLAVSFLLSSTLGLGTIYLNNIIGNDDQRSVNIEQVNFAKDVVKLNTMFGLSPPGGKTQGTYIEDTEMVRGDMFIPHNLVVDRTATVTGQLNFNGGLFADALPLPGSSFSVAKDTGITTVLGVTNPNGGINVQNGLFTVEAFTGRTTIAKALLRPNGDTLVQNTLFKISAVDGSVTTKGEADVQKDLILGSTTNEDRYVTRVPSVSTANPGKTGSERRLVIKGQDGISTGGDTVVDPGYPTSVHGSLTAGSIILGRGGLSADLLTITRATVVPAAGTTTIAGQTASSRGGDLMFQSGSSAPIASPSTLYLQVGANLGNAANGQILLGTAANADLTVRRNPLTYAASASRTWIKGQSVVPTGGQSGGKLQLQAGSPAFDLRPGNVVLAPGTNAIGGLGRVKLGDSIANPLNPLWSTVQQGLPLFITRQTTLSDAGQQVGASGPGFPLSTASRTNFQGQSSRQSRGGSISFVCGNSAVNRFDLTNVKGADLYLTNGASSASSAANPRRIYWGRDTQPLSIKRDDNQFAAATSTTIRGQVITKIPIPPDPNSAFGGSVFLTSGTGSPSNGDISLRAADSVGNEIGGIASSATGNGNTIIQTGSSIFVSAGGSHQLITPFTAVGQGGNIQITAGSGHFNGGGIVMAAVASTTEITPMLATVPVSNGPLTPNGLGTLTYKATAPTGPPTGTTTFTGLVIVTNALNMQLAEVDFQVNQAPTTTPRPVFSLSRNNNANRVYTPNPAAGMFTYARPCDYLPAADTNCMYFPAQTVMSLPTGAFYLQTTIPVTTPVPPLPGTYTSFNPVLGAFNSAPTPNYHHVFRYTTAGVSGAFDNIIAPRYDGVAFGMGDSTSASLYHFNAVPRLSLLAPSIWRWTLWDPQVAPGHSPVVGGGNYQPPTPTISNTVGGSNTGPRIPPFNINPGPGNGRTVGQTSQAIPVGVGSIGAVAACSQNTNGTPQCGNLYGKSKTERSFRGVIFDIALNLNRVICALHNIGYIQAIEPAWNGPNGPLGSPGPIPINRRCDPTPVRLLPYLQQDGGDPYYGNKFIPPVYA